MRRIIAAIAIVFALSLSNQSALAHIGEAVEIDPSHCIVEPRSVDSLLPLLPEGTPPPREPQEEFVAPEGEPVDAETTEAVASFVYETSACLLTGNLLASFALQTDAYISATFGRIGATEETLEGMAASTGSATNASSIVTINDIVILEDERIGVAVTEVLDMGGLVETFVMYYYLVEHEESYLMDDYVLVAVT